MGKSRILLVEDCPTDALIVRHALRKEYEVEHVASVADARQKLLDSVYAAVITDHGLKTDTGLDLLRWITAQEIDVPVLLMSGQGDEHLAAETIKLGAYDYIVKTEESLSALAVPLKHALQRHELERRAQTLQQIVEHASDGIITLDMSGQVLTANHAVEPMFGFTPEEIVGQSVKKLFPGEAAARDISQMLASGASGVGWKGELSAHSKVGDERQINMSVSILRDRLAKPTALIAIARDMTERRRLLDKLKRLSVTDNLTDLYNHRFFHDRLHYEFMRAQRYGAPLGCIMVDVDFFKSVNDTHGHLVGDEVLRELAKLIKQATREVDVVSRYGGEEFAVLLPNTDITGALRCAENIWKTVGGAGINTEEGALSITVSVGVAEFSPDVRSEEELHRRADDALLAAKRRGRNNVCVWNKNITNTAIDMPDFRNHDVANICEDIRRLVLPAKEHYLETVRPVLDALCRRHPNLRRHSTNVAIFATELAQCVPLRPEEKDALQHAALFHDIGHIVTPGELLNKPSSLARHEQNIVRRHVAASETIMQELSLSKLEIQYVRAHHERYDGKGYPNGLKGKAIPVGARILAIADAYDAMTSPRPWRSVFTEEAAFTELRDHAGTQFDPEMVEQFIAARQAELMALVSSD